MAWIELHQSLFTHRKTMAAADALGLPEVYVVAHLAALWTWALDNAQDGVIEASPRVIARACQWTSEPQQLLDALTTSGFLIPGDVPNRYVIHDWHDYAGRLVERRQANADRMRRARAEKDARTEPQANAHVQDESQLVQDTCVTRAPHVQGLPYPTQPNPTITVENPTGEGGGQGEKREQSESASAPSDEDARPPEKASGGAGSIGGRGTRLPDAWEPLDADREAIQGECPGLDLDKATREFRDYWRGVSGSKGVKLDWTATWRNAMRNAFDRGKFLRSSPNVGPTWPAPSRASPPPGPTLDDLVERNRQRRANAERLAPTEGNP